MDLCPFKLGGSLVESLLFYIDDMIMFSNDTKKSIVVVFDRFKKLKHGTSLLLNQTKSNFFLSRSRINQASIQSDILPEGCLAK